MSFNEANTVEQMVLDACIQNGWEYVPGPSHSRWYSIEVGHSDHFETPSICPLPRKAVR